MLLTLGTLDPRRVVDVAKGRRKNLDGSPLAERVRAFHSYETWLGGFVDSGALVRRLEASDGAAKLLRELGLDGIESLTFHAGFEGKYLRGTVVMDVPRERHGLLYALVAGDEIEPGKLPPLPPDVTAVTAVALDADALWKSVLNVVDASAADGSVGESGTSPARSEVADFERAAGLSLGPDLLEKLGSPLVVYNSPGQGPLLLGTAAAIPVRGGEATLAVVSQVFRTSGALTGTEVSLAEHAPHGGAMHVLRFGGSNELPYWSHGTDGEWLVLAMIPQTVSAALARTAGRLAAWAPPDEATRIVREARGGDSRLVMLRVVDPRPPLRVALAVLPVAVGGLATQYPPLRDAVRLVPNTQAVTEPLTHNVSAVFDDGDALRYEAYATVPLPPGAEWLDSMAPLFGLPLAQFYFLFMAQ